MPRAAFDRVDTGLEIVAVDDLTTSETPAPLSTYDSTSGPWSPRGR